MRKGIDCKVDEMFAGGEGAGLCIAPAGERERRWLHARSEQGVIAAPFPGLYAKADSWAALPRRQQALEVVRALSLQHPAWVFCFASAALVHGLEVSFWLLDEVHIVSTRLGTARGVARHYAHLDEDEVEVVAGIRVTTLRRTAFDCARDMSFPLALAVADSAVRAGGIAPDELASYFCVRYRGCRGVKRAAAIASVADGRSENGGESYARAVMIEQGVALPELQVEVEDPLNRSRGWYRVDYLWHLEGFADVAGELDGREKIEDPAMLAGRSTVDALRDERQRESRLTALGLRVARFTFAQVRQVDPFLRILDAYQIPRGAPDTGLLDAVGPGRTCKEWAWLR